MKGLYVVPHEWERGKWEHTAADTQRYSAVCREKPLHCIVKTLVHCQPLLSLSADYLSYMITAMNCMKSFIQTHKSSEKPSFFSIVQLYKLFCAWYLVKWQVLWVLSMLNSHIPTCSFSNSLPLSCCYSSIKRWFCPIRFNYALNPSPLYMRMSVYVYLVLLKWTIQKSHRQNNFPRQRCDNL